ncbi:hypothetical protein Val02_79740 [Virgisporangium aliadipatigenens]|uniref:Peptidoglycan recognition protein family domain-containing protein n=1 Tax=Virgisporangium aliadipatigenens TaxID=741659 RepID=A0A8J4DVE3_9ACTN|nr:N-acetylmuramoyl-L-alanine amidase [Virgisporangium aliadipatigenens]GIJ51088.1 hypothetical protein Val02_79740 [Virgisporangium aliadipatigenens]
MRKRAAKRHRTGAGLLATALLLVLLIATEPDGRPEDQATGPVAAPAQQQPAAEKPAGAPVAGPPTTGVSPRAVRIPLGRFDGPAEGVRARTGVPKGVPVKGKRSLTVRREGTGPFSAVGLTWNGAPTADLTVAVRSHVPSKGWTQWRTADTAPADRDPDGRATAAKPGRKAPTARRNGTDLVWLGPSDGLELVVTGRATRDLTDLAVDLIDPLTAPGDDAGPPPEKPAEAGRVYMPPIASRAAWGADERLMTWNPEMAGPVAAIAFHHTATGNDYLPDDVPKLLRSVYYFHAVSRGWGDIGYNVLVDRFGRLWEGRRGGLNMPVIGAHAGGFNRNTAGISAIGDHRTTPVPDGVIESAARYTAWKLSLDQNADPRGTTRLTGGGNTSRHQPGTTITVPRVFPHRLTNTTECPGDRGMDALDPIRNRAAALMGTRTRESTLRPRLATWNPAEARWRVNGAADVPATPGDLPAAADYDGDGATDLATWTPADGRWHVPGAPQEQLLGGPGDRPVPADYTGDGKAEPAVWRPADGVWQFAAGNSVQWGSEGDIPLPGDYDGDGKAEPAVWRPAEGTWYVRGKGTYRLGESYHVPVPADYDGDGDVEPASWSPITHRWFVWGAAPVTFGEDGDVPVVGQFDGDGKADRAVWRPPAGPDAEGTWLISGGASVEFGRTGDIPVAIP